MILEVVNSFKEALGKEIDAPIAFIETNTLGTSLHDYAVNLVLFSSHQHLSLSPNSNVQKEIKENEAIVTRRPMLLTLNLLLLFNFSSYEECLTFYGDTIRYLYSNPVFNDTNYSYDVTLANFSPREEIEIWNNFGVSGLPILRYELNFVQLSSSTNIAQRLIRRISRPEAQSSDPVRNDNYGRRW